MFMSLFIGVGGVILLGLGCLLVVSSFLPVWGSSQHATDDRGFSLGVAAAIAGIAMIFAAGTWV